MSIDSFLAEFRPLKLELHGVRLPEIKIEDSVKKKFNIKTEDNFEFLRQLAVVGFKKLNLKKGSEEYKVYGERTKKELDVIKDLNFTDYFLMVWDVINFCQDNNIPTGAGRGSAAGSLLLFLIGVTKIDPIKYGLYFERFISKARSKKTVVDGITYLDGSLLCDIDLDFCYYNRPKVLKYLDDKYKGKTSKILTFNTLSAKLLMKELGKIVGMKSEDEMTNVTSMIPKLHGVVEDVDKAYEQVSEFKEWCDENPRVYQTALKLKDLIKNKGVHPSGIMISYDELADTCPTELSSDKEMVSSFDMQQVALFTVKLDALGLRGVSVIDDVCKSLNLNLFDIDVDHHSIYNNLQDLKYPQGLFQIEADLAFKTTQKVKPKNFSELAAILALARPGAMQFIDQFAAYTNHKIYEPIHPFFDSILKETGGVAIYQEQLMQMAHKIGFTLEEAEILRRIVGKKKLEEVKEWQEKIKNKVKENKLDSKIGDILWRILNDSASYSFNKSHSAAYASLSATTVYLKFNHPQQFYLSLLKMSQHEPDPIAEIAKIHKEMIHFGLELLPPSLTHSKMDFTIEGKNIRFGLSAIKGVADKTIEKLNNFKKEHENKFKVFQSAKEAGLSIGVLAALIQAGTLTHFGNNRLFMVYEAQLWNVLTDKEKIVACDISKEFNYNLVAIVKTLCEKKNEKGKPIIKESRMATIRKKTEKYKAIYEQNKICQDFANWWYEKKLLGYVISKKLIDIYRHKIPDADTIDTITELKDGSRVEFVGYVNDNPKLGTSRTARKSKYAKYEISDETGAIKVLIFNDSLEGCKEINKDGLPQKEDVVIVKGVRKGDDAVFANIIAKQKNQIYTKLLDLKEEEKSEPSKSILI